jgi:type II secretory pathway predicted ATPase ExeA
VGMGKTWTMREAVAHLKAHPPRTTDRAIAARATNILLGWGGAPTDAVSRPLVCMVRRGTGVGNGHKGFKVRAIWEALRLLGVIPQLPAEIQAADAPSKSSMAYLRAKLRRLESTQRHGQEVVDIPMLTKPMLKYFGFDRNPVYDEIRSPRDLWWGRQHLEAKAILVEAAEEARFVRLAGRRGAGKSLVWNEVRESLRLRDDIVLVEASAVISGTLTETHLITTVIQAIKRKLDGRDEVFPESQNPAKRALAMRYLLLQQKRANRKVVLAIDEAHDLKAQTFLALKRFLDEVDGVGRRLLGIILIGQNPEAAYNPRARDLSEVVLRLQTYRLQPMNDEIPDYLRWKIQRAGAKVGEIITPAALKAIGTRCPYPLDANAQFAQLVIDAYGAHEKPIGREMVESTAPDEDEVAAETGAGA